METKSHIDDRPLRIPPIVWFLAAVLTVALVAIFVFNAAISTVLNYGFFTLMIGSHFFMHGSHGGHRHGQPSDSAEPNTNQQTGDNGGCH